MEEEKIIIELSKKPLCYWLQSDWEKADLIDEYPTILELMEKHSRDYFYEEN